MIDQEIRSMSRLASGAYGYDDMAGTGDTHTLAELVDRDTNTSEILPGSRLI